MRLSFVEAETSSERLVQPTSQPARSPLDVLITKQSQLFSRTSLSFCCSSPFWWLSVHFIVIDANFISSSDELANTSNNLFLMYGVPGNCNFLKKCQLCRCSAAWNCIGSLVRRDNFEVSLPSGLFIWCGSLGWFALIMKWRSVEIPVVQFPALPVFLSLDIWATDDRTN